MGKSPRKGPGGQPYTPPPRNLGGIPGAARVKPKSMKRGGGLRARWKAPNGNIYEWDSQHGTLEKYDSNGRHLGEIDPDTGEELKATQPARSIEP